MWFLFHFCAFMHVLYVISITGSCCHNSQHVAKARFVSKQFFFSLTLQVKVSLTCDCGSPCADRSCSLTRTESAEVWAMSNTPRPRILSPAASAQPLLSVTFWLHLAYCAHLTFTSIPNIYKKLQREALKLPLISDETLFVQFFFWRSPFCFFSPKDLS